MSLKITFEEYMKRLKGATSNIVPISEYFGLSKPIEYECLDCGHKWKVNEARNALRFGCPNCVHGKLREKRIETEDQFRKKLEEKQPNLIPNDIYRGNRIKYHCICKIHNCDVYTTPDKYLYGNQGCLMCFKEQHNRVVYHTSKSFKETLSQINPSIKLLSKYYNNKCRVDVSCKICGHKWNPVAKTLISKNPCGCPKCAGNAVKTQNEFENELAKTHPEVTLLSPYIKSNEKVHVLCNNCGNDFWITPNKLQQDRHCPYCNISDGERIIKDFLEEAKIYFIYQYRFDGLVGMNGGLLSYDFYLPNKNVLIEFQGEQHEQPVEYFGGKEKFKIQQEHDKRKREYAKEHNIELLEIWYWDYNNIEQILSEKIFSKAS